MLLNYYKYKFVKHSYGMVSLFIYFRGQNLFESISKIIRILNLHDFMEIARKSGIRQGLGRNIKKVMNNWLVDNLNEYQVTRNKTKLKEIIRVTRPNNKDEVFQNYMRYVSRGELTFPRAKALKKVINDL